MSSALTSLDPTGTLSAVSAGVSLVAAALRLGTAAKKFHDSRGGGGGGGGGGGRSASVSGGGPLNLHRSQSNPTEGPVTPKDPERERRAYETVNFVLREFGSRICAAGMVDEHALTKALMAATQHIEVNLFSGEANRLFESLAPRLADPILVNSVFTSIYFIGALSAELSSSLPNYKDTYVPVGPRLVQQLFHAAIGEDAFRDNLTANLDAYKTLITTAGLLRPTDIGYATFPRFPSLAPCRYSSKAYNDVRLNKNVYDKLTKHFERAGFPQPTPARQAEVGLIRDWKFLSGDSNSRAFDVERADKNIGENFGRVIHWLICSAERLPPGQAVIAYYDQHIELISWIQHRMGYAVLYPAIDLNLGGPHAQLERRLRMTINSWVIIMPSEAAQAAKRANAEHWMSSHVRTATQFEPQIVPKTITNQQANIAQPAVTHTPIATVPTQSVTDHGSTTQIGQVPATSSPHQNVPAALPVRQPSRASSNSISTSSMTNSTNRTSMAIPSSPPMSLRNTTPSSPTVAEMPAPGNAQTVLKTIEQQIAEIDQHFRLVLVPQFQRLWSYPSVDAGVRESQCSILAHTTERETINRLDRFQIPETHPARMQRKRLIDQAQELLDFLPAYKELGPTVTHRRPLPGALQLHSQQMTTNNVEKPSSPQGPQSTGVSPPPYSTASPSSGDPNNTGISFPFPAASNPAAIRRKAPPPPRRFVMAMALYDFDPDPAHEEELGFKEDDEIEIIEKTAAMEEDGWGRARVKGTKRIGLVPLEYLKIEEKKPDLDTASTSSRPPSHANPASITQITQSATTGSQNANPNQLAGPSHPSADQQASVTMDPSITYPQTTTNAPQSIHNVMQNAPPTPQRTAGKSHISKLEVAGLAASSMKAATEIGVLVESAHGHDDGHDKTLTAAAIGQQQQQLSSGDFSGQGVAGEQIHSSGRDDAFGNLSNNSTNEQAAVVDEDSRAAVDGDSPPMVDLSAFGQAPFNPQIPVAAPGQFYIPPEIFTQQSTEADLTSTSTTNNGETTSATDVVQGTTTSAVVDDPGNMTSPLAALATTSVESTTYTASTVTGSNGATSTFQASIDGQDQSPAGLEIDDSNDLDD